MGSQLWQHLCREKNKLKWLGYLRSEYEIPVGVWGKDLAGNETETNKIWITFLGNKLLSLSLLMLRYTKVSQSKPSPAAPSIIPLKIPLQESCNTGMLYQSKWEYGMECNELCKYNVRIRKNERTSKFSDGCCSTVSIYFVQLKSILLTLTAGPYETEICRSTDLSIDCKGKYSTSLFFLLITKLRPFLPTRGYRANLIFLSMPIRVNKAGLGCGFKCCPVITTLGDG